MTDQRHELAPGEHAAATALANEIGLGPHATEAMLIELDRTRKDRDKWRSMAERWEAQAASLSEALRKIASSAPCTDNHKSFNSPDQPCDQRIAEEALSDFEKMKGETWK